MSSKYRSYRGGSSDSNEGSSTLTMILLSVFIFAIIAGSIYYGSQYYRNQENFFDDSSSPLNKNYTLQYFSMTNCGYCNDFQPTWDNIVTDAINNQAIINYTTVKYDISDGGDGMAAGRKYNVNSTPTILLVNNTSGAVIPYEGKRNAADIIAFANQNAK
uniref:Thioredoxin-like fold domain-containing protein n=1 Tax=viral metagenome TaxID=1070528 RepID=A0A6C0CHI5_9ZZZZ